ncbi:MAG: sigma-54-dependent Fis family transcriptional regulator [Saprospiraceae bacterium]|nr:sigma-54-dependent Fis family transcriptional regulator [Saprospiraceae bacterium]
MANSKANILIIDDESDIRNLLSRIIRLEGFNVFQAETGKEGLRKLERERIHVVICDVKLPDVNGVSFVPRLKEAQPFCEVILLTAFGKIEDGVQAIKNGAFNYMTKGDDNNKIIPLVNQAAEKALLRFKVEELESKVAGLHRFDQIIGQSPPMKKAMDLARKVAETDTTVLLTGETGSGKEVFSQAIHYESDRNNKPFVAVNCSALGKELLESEMFGHLSGSFTGASRDKQGLFQEADGGTIFLDEIGEMDLVLQAKLLRVLETGTFLRVGDTKETKVDVRIIAATNRNLRQESDNGNFRLDLYYRLSVFNIHLPGLSERREDIRILAEHFIRMIAGKMNRRPPAMDPAFQKALEKHSWPGNIRELKNVIERAVILASDELLTTEALPFDFLYSVSEEEPNALRLSAIEKQHIRKVLAFTEGNKTRTAELLGIGLTTLYRKMEEYGIAK